MMRIPQARCFFYEDHKRRLKGIFGGVVVSQNAPANAQDHRAMSMNENLESRFFSRLSGHELRNELTIQPIAHDADFIKGGNRFHGSDRNSIRHPDFLAQSLL
jgi:hypothetical protein